MSPPRCLRISGQGSVVRDQRSRIRSCCVDVRRWWRDVEAVPGPDESRLESWRVVPSRRGWFRAGRRSPGHRPSGPAMRSGIDWSTCGDGAAPPGSRMLVTLGVASGERSSWTAPSPEANPSDEVRTRRVTVGARTSGSPTRQTDHVVERSSLARGDCAEEDGSLPRRVGRNEGVAGPCCIHGSGCPDAACPPAWCHLPHARGSGSGHPVVL